MKISTQVKIENTIIIKKYYILIEEHYSNNECWEDTKDL